MLVKVSVSIHKRGQRRDGLHPRGLLLRYRLRLPREEDARGECNNDPQTQECIELDKPP